MACSALQRGVTLAEMLVTVAVLAVVASLAVSASAPAASFAADAVAGEAASALRFAQREAIRTGAWHVVNFDTASQSLRVYRLKTVVSVSEDSTKVLHPVDKSEYRIDFSNAPDLRGLLVSAEFKYEDNTTRSYLGFDPDGVPADIRGALKVTALKSSGKVLVRSGHVEREVAVQPVNGRVTQ